MGLIFDEPLINRIKTGWRKKFGEWIDSAIRVITITDDYSLVKHG